MPQLATDIVFQKLDPLAERSLVVITGLIHPCVKLHAALHKVHVHPPVFNSIH